MVTLSAKTIPGKRNGYQRKISVRLKKELPLIWKDRTDDRETLTEEIFDGGVVKMYRTFDYDSQYATQIEMPYVRLREEYPEGGGEPFRYTELLDYDFGIETVNIYFTVSDFYYGFKPGAMLFRCVLLY